MKLAITVLAAVAAMGIAASSPAEAKTKNNCVVGAEHHNFFELNCGKKTPWWWTPVRYKNIGGGEGFAAPSDRKKHDCKPPPPRCVTIYKTRVR